MPPGPRARFRRLGQPGAGLNPFPGRNCPSAGSAPGSSTPAHCPGGWAAGRGKTAGRGKGDPPSGPDSGRRPPSPALPASRGEVSHGRRDPSASLQIDRSSRRRWHSERSTAPGALPAARRAAKGQKLAIAPHARGPAGQRLGREHPRDGLIIVSDLERPADQAAPSRQDQPVMGTQPLRVQGQPRRVRPADRRVSGRRPPRPQSRRLRPRPQ